MPEKPNTAKPDAARPRRYALPKRFSAALSEDAYARLRALNARHGFGNN
ncbi:MAG: hypothetical protein P1U37_06300 [Minwuia sp.]|nr:hypothetical protein [Minwuia sp.]